MSYLCVSQIRALSVIVSPKDNNTIMAVEYRTSMLAELHTQHCGADTPATVARAGLRFYEWLCWEVFSLSSL